MAKPIKKSKTKNVRNKKKAEKYNADNEIIIGVTTKPKEVRVEKKKSTRTKPSKKNVKRTSNQKEIKQKNRINHPSRIQKKNKQTLTKEQEIKKMNKKRFIFSILLLMATIIGFIIYFLTTPMFNIAYIEITGNEKNSVDTYVSLSKIELNTTNLFAVTKSKITENIKENAYVESVSFKRKLPNTIQIHVVERQAVYQIKYNDQYIYLDKQGYILEFNQESNDLIKIEGLSSTKEALNVGQRFNLNDLKQLDIVLKIVNYCKYNNIKNSIESIDVTDPSNYIIYFANNEQIAYLGDASNLSERILWLKTILTREKGNKGEIFINGSLNDKKVYFKPAT